MENLKGFAALERESTKKRARAKESVSCRDSCWLINDNTQAPNISRNKDQS